MDGLLLGKLLQCAGHQRISGSGTIAITNCNSMALPPRMVVRSTWMSALVDYPQLYFFGNTASRPGGAIASFGSGSLSITGCDFGYNTCTGRTGGAIANLNVSDANGIEISNTQFLNNSSDDGGAIFNNSAVPNLTRCSLYMNGIPRAAAR